MPQVIQELKDQGPLPQPERELWPGINPYNQRWISDEIGQDNFERLLQLPTETERRTGLVKLTEARVERLKQEQPVNSRELFAAMQSLGTRQQECGQASEANKTFSDLLGMYESLGTDPQDRLRNAHGRAHAKFCMGEYIEAERLYREALPFLQQEPLGTDSPQYLGTWRTIIEAVAKQGDRWDDARRLLDEGFELIREMRGGSWQKFEAEELEAMEEVREMVYKAQADAGHSRLNESAKL